MQSEERFAPFAVDQVFCLSACTVERSVNVLRAAFVQRGSDVTDIEFPAEHLVFLARAGLDARHGTALPGPGFQGIARLGVPRQHGMPALGTAHADVIGDGVPRPCRARGIAGKPEDVIDAVRLTPGSSPPRGRNGYRRGW